MRWRAWYENEIFDSQDVLWKQLPSTGLQVLIVYEEGGRRVFSGGDWYWIFNGEVGYVSSGEWGTTQPKPESVSCLSCIKQGTGVADEEFNRIMEEAYGYAISTN
jgi:hypothetical protein